MNIPYVFKKCTKCGRLLVASSVNFYKHKRYKYGLESQCKECRKEYREQNKEAKAEYMKEYREQNKEAIAEYMKEYYEANKQAILEHQKEYCKKHYEANKEAKAEYQKKWYEANRETIAERRKKYYEANKEAKAEYYEANKEAIAERQKKYRQTPQGQVVRFNITNRRRTKEQNQGSGITKEQWLEMMNFFNWECAYSGKTLTKETRSIDHIDPLNNGGANEVWNCVPMDKSLNISKKDKEMLDWYIKQPFCTAERLLKIYNWQEYAYKKWHDKEEII